MKHPSVLLLSDVRWAPGGERGAHLLGQPCCQRRSSRGFLVRTWRRRRSGWSRCKALRTAPACLCSPGDTTSAPCRLREGWREPCGEQSAGCGRGPETRRDTNRSGISCWHKVSTYRFLMAITISISFIPGFFSGIHLINHILTSCLLKINKLRIEIWVMYCIWWEM